VAFEPAVSEDPTLIDVPPALFSWAQILHSWFWRLYDHLGILVLCNSLWFAGLMSLLWSFKKTGCLGTLQSPGLPGLLCLYLLSAFYSVGWSYGVFRIFTGQGFKFRNYWEGVKLFSIRAVFLSGVWAGVALLSYWNFRLFPTLIKQWEVGGYLMEGLSFWVILFWFSMSFFQWPLLYFQDVSSFKVIKRSFLLVLGNSLLSFALVAGLIAISSFLSFFFVVGWVFVGMTVVCSLPVVALEKILLKYRITLFDQPLLPLLEIMETERKRGWRELLKPWEYR